MPRWMYRRRYWTGHSRDGFHLSVMDRWLPAVAAETVVHAILAVLGHPDAGRGLGRIDAVNGVAFTFLNCPNRLCTRDREVLRLPLTEEQALTIEPSWAESTWWKDDEVVRRERGALLDEMVRESAELGLYESTAEPRPTR